MPQTFLTSIDLSKNQLLNAAIQNLAAAPAAPVAGQIYFNTVDSRIFFWDGTAWVDISGDLRSVIGGAGLNATYSGDGDEVTLDVIVDNVTIEINADTLRVKDLGITSAKLADNAVTTVKITNNNVTLGKLATIGNLRVLGNISGSAGNVAELVVVTDLASASTTTLATSQAIKAYIDNAVGGLGNLEGAWDASTAAFPVAAGGTKRGDYWFVSVAGTVGGEAFNIGDVIIANKDAASTTLIADWIRLEVNRQQATATVLGLVQLATQAEVNTGTETAKVVTPETLAGRTATETRTGIAEIATQVETDAGTDDTRIVTPLKLKTLLDNRTGGFAANVGNGTNTSFVLTHGLNTRDVTVEIYNNTTFERVFTDIAITTINTATVTFAVAPALNAFRVVIKK